MIEYPRELIETLTRRVAGTVSADDYINWASSALEQGLDTPNLRILAGLPSSTWRSDAEPYFDRALNELQIYVGDKEEILREYAKLIARKIINGELTAETGAERIEHEVLRPLGHPKDLQPWCFLSGGLDPTTFDTLTATELKRVAHEEALKMIGG